MAEYIMTYTKNLFYPTAPRREDIRIEDIAHALSLICRANGHFPQFYSVAQHSLSCAYEALARGLSDRIALACLIHDGSESYLSDITRPVKKELDAYREYEKNLQTAIYDKFIGSLTEQEQKVVKLIDDTMLYYEFYHFMGAEICDKLPKDTEPDYDFKAFDEVEREFLELFEKISGRM